MHIFSRRFEQVIVEVKEQLLIALQESPYKQETIADACETTQASISRWFGYNTEHLPPMHILAVLPKEIAVPLCRYFAQRHGYDVIPQVPTSRTDGSLEDECLDIAKKLGDIISDARQNPDKARKLLRHFQEMQEVVQRGIAEVQGMQRRGESV